MLPQVCECVCVCVCLYWLTLRVEHWFSSLVSCAWTSLSTCGVFGVTLYPQIRQDQLGSTLALLQECFGFNAIRLDSPTGPSGAALTDRGCTEVQITKSQSCSRVGIARIASPMISHSVGFKDFVKSIDTRFADCSTICNSSAQIPSPLLP